MIYCCKDCGFLFQRVGEVRECPFCQGTRIRFATEEEEKCLQVLLRQEAKRQKRGTSSR